MRGEVNPRGWLREMGVVRIREKLGLVDIQVARPMPKLEISFGGDKTRQGRATLHMM